jgi:hypothetical protein
MNEVVLASCNPMPAGDPEHAPLIEAFAALGIEARAVAWDADYDWSQTRAVLIRSTWDYHHRRDQFVAWAKRVPNLFNPASIVEWNTHKSYLRELELRGVPIIPTRWVARGERLDLREVQWNEFVIKPAVSGGAWKTLRTTVAELPKAQEHLDALVQTHDAMVQPYLSAVEGYGERSLIWIDGEVTHALRKDPALAVGANLDGGVRVEPSAEELALSEKTLGPIASQLSYARVDTLRDDAGVLRLMELELTEPFLFFRFGPKDAPARLARSVARRSNL